MLDETEVNSHDWPGAGSSGSGGNRLDEHPSVILRDLCSRPLPPGHVITFANEKGGVGKSTLAFHAAIALASEGASVLAIDLDRRQQTLHRTLEAREATARALDAKLACPTHFVLEQQNAAQMNQEILRVGANFDFLVIDVAGHDSPIARRAIAMADTLVTPINSSHADLDQLGRFSPVTRKLQRVGQFGALVQALQDEREKRHMGRFDWIVVRNRLRNCESRQISNIDEALAQLSLISGFRLGKGLSERVAYRELLPFGLTHLDLKNIRGLARLRARTGDELGQLMRDFSLPGIEREKAAAAGPRRARMGQRTALNYRNRLEHHLGVVG
jgi:chromosome partitioning protein